MNYTKIYANFLKKFLKPQKPLRIIFDCSNGTAGLVVRQLKIENLKLKIINGNPDGNFPAHGPNPLKKSAISNLQLAIYKHNADFGIIFDADGDRAFFVDNFGRPVDSDIIAYLLMLKGGFKPPYLIDVAEGKKPFHWFAPKMDIIETRAGHYFIKKMMREKDIEFAAEHSGHYYSKDFFYADSGIMAAIFIINAVSKMPYSLADFVDLLPLHYQSGEINIRYKVPSVKIQELLKKIEKKYLISNTKYLIQTSRLDGLTMEFSSPAGEWWLNLRHSNTESLLRLNIEAENKKVLQKEKKKLMDILRNA